jgi:ABC-type multidrug transport system fused ATPase/permease subunit
MAMTKVESSTLQKFKNSAFGRSFRLLRKNDRKKILAVTVLQIFSGLLDLLGVAIIGVLGALTVIGFGSGQPGNRVSAVLELLQLEGRTLQSQAFILGTAAAFVFILRTAITVVFTRRTLFFLSRRGALISEDLISRLLNQGLLDVQKRNIQETLYAVTQGVNLITMGVLATTVTMVADVSLLVILSTGLLYIDPTIAISTFFMFAIIGLVIYRLMSVRARNLGVQNSILSIKSSQKISEVLEAYRENIVRNRRYYYSREIARYRSEIASSLAEMQFMPYISKYVIEATVVLGGLLICGLQFWLQDAQRAVANLAIFLAAGTRIAPAVLRIQTGAIQIRMNLGGAKPTLDLIDELKDLAPIGEFQERLDTRHQGFIPAVSINNLSLLYPGKEEFALRNISLSFEAGSVIAIVGSSGAGKTSLVDVLLGAISPTEGFITISGNTPAEAIKKWPGAIAYVPQNVMVCEGTIRENIALGFPDSDITDDLLLSASHIAHLDQLISELPDGLESYIESKGTNLSGGQRQRIGIARAMFTRPRLLVLDEATSSLDGQTEAYISDAIQTLKGDVTVITIAHRLSTVREADAVVYLDRGVVAAIGSFDEVRRAIPDFDDQAKLMGL